MKIINNKPPSLKATTVMKRKSVLILPGICLLAILLVQCNHFDKAASGGNDRTTDEAAIRKADSAWSVATGSKQINEFMNYVAEDGIIQAPNALTAKGKDAVQKLMSGFFGIPGFTVKWQATKVEVSSSGDIGYSLGAYELSVNDAQGKPITDHGKYTTIWKKQSDGSWKVAVDMFNTDMPAQQ
jgi:ketosteroid isomerase-like protein